MITVVETVDHSVSKLQNLPATTSQQGSGSTDTNTPSPSRQQQQQHMQELLSEKDAELTSLRTALKSVSNLAAQARAAVISSSTAATIG